MRYLFPLSPYNQQRQFQKPVWIYPVHLAMYATYLRDRGHEVVWGSNDDDEVDAVFHDQVERQIIKNDTQIDALFEKLPAPDRVFTDAKNPRWQNYGNYKLHPATHMMSAFGCWHGKCSFCHENGKPYITRDPLDVADEVKACHDLGFKEIFDDAATFPCDKWCEIFYLALCRHGIDGKMKFGCNLRIDSKNDFKLMKRIGYRMVLFGVESANQLTLTRINKGINVENIEPTLRRASQAGLEPHITVMFGYPWETHDDAMNTVKFAHEMLLKGYSKSVQASIFCAPRTPPDEKDPNHRYVGMTYDIYKHPLFWYQKIKDLRSWQDLIYLLKRINLIGGAK